MALISKSLVLTTSDQDLFTIAAGTEAIAHSVVFFNTSGSSADVTLKIYKANTASTTVVGIKTVATKDYFAYPKVINLQAGDKLIAVASAGTTFTANYSYWTTTDIDFQVAQGFTSQGVYAGGTTYTVNDTVYYNSGTASTTGMYVSRVTGNIGNTPSSSPTQWLQMTAQGLQGTDGGVGKHSIPVTASGIIPALTNGPSYSKLEAATNKNMLITLDFDTTTAETGQFFIPMPKAWNEGTITFKVIWKHEATTTNFGVAWGLSAVGVSDGDAGDVAFGTEIIVTDTGGTTKTVYHTPESSALTVAGSPVAQDYVMFKIRRVVADGADTMAIDAGLLAVVIYITTDAGSDT